MKTKTIMAVVAMALSVSANAEVIKEKQLYCHDVFSMQRVEAAFKSGNKDAIAMVIANEKECRFTRKPVKVIVTMNWPDSQIKKAMIVDPSMPVLAGFELWTFGFSLSRK